MGLLLLDDQLPGVLEIFNKLDLLKEADMVIDDLANHFFNNLRIHLRKNEKLAVILEFIK
jgi:hypothetical protein